MFTRLSPAQASMLRTLDKLGCTVWFYGLDAKDRPVIRFKDKRRTTDLIAMPRTGTHGMGLKPEPPIRWFTEKELDFIEPKTHEVLVTLYRGGE